MKKDVGIYVHIPFCIHKCSYCDFISFTGKENLIEKYIEAVIKEIENMKINSKYNIKTVYIGGGTPSILESKFIGKILKVINLSNSLEVTIEINPGTVTEEKIKSYIDFGINRISIGLQSISDKLLKQMERIHDSEAFLDTYKIARKLGFRNINVDLMLGLPNQTMEELEKSLNTVIKLNPEHISIYSLILEDGTKLEKQVSRGELKMIDDVLERKMYWKTKCLLEKSGYEHYEISNFAKKRFYF